MFNLSDLSKAKRTVQVDLKSPPCIKHLFNASASALYAGWHRSESRAKIQSRLPGKFLDVESGICPLQEARPDRVQSLDLDQKDHGQLDDCLDTTSSSRSFQRWFLP